MSTLSASINSSFISAAFAQQQVQGDQLQVRSDQALLRQDQAQLDKDSARSATVQQQTQGIEQNLLRQAQQAGLDQQAQQAQSAQPAALPVQPAQLPQTSVNTSGQTVGKIISVVA